MNTITATAESSIQQVAIERAIKYLTASKAEFAVRMPDGSFVGSLEVVIKSTRRKSNNWRIAMPNYIAEIRAMQIGDVVAWEVDSNDLAESFRSTASSQGCHLFGKGAFMTTVKDRFIEAMRLE